MAVWQFDLWIVPKIEVLRRFEVVPDYVDLDWFEAIDWWGSTSADKLTAFLTDVLPFFDELAWGNPDETFARLSMNSTRIEEVFIRVDVRNLEKAFLRSLIDFAHSNELIFFALESNRFVDSEWNAFIRALCNSRASLFAEDPERFLKDTKYLDKINKEIKRRFE